MLLDATFLSSAALLLLRVVIAIIFFSSGKSHIRDPQGRGESIGMPPAVTAVLGAAEMMAAVSLGLGIYIQVGAAIVIFVMLGAIYKKMIVWKTGFYAEKGFGWHYDLLLLAGCLVIFATHGGEYIVLRYINL